MRTSEPKGVSPRAEGFGGNGQSQFEPKVLALLTFAVTGRPRSVTCRYGRPARAGRRRDEAVAPGGQAMACGGEFQNSFW